MKLSKELMQKAHKLTKEIKVEYPQVNYQMQLGLCISYLLENEEELIMVELKGSDKQVAWAEDIRKEVVELIEKMENKVPELIKQVEESRNRNVSEQYNADFKILKEFIYNKDHSKFYIDNFSALSYNKRDIEKINNRYAKLEKTKKNEEYYKSAIEENRKVMEYRFACTIENLIETEIGKITPVMRRLLSLMGRSC